MTLLGGQTYTIQGAIRAVLRCGDVDSNECHLPIHTATDSLDSLSTRHQEAANKQISARFRGEPRTDRLRSAALQGVPLQRYALRSRSTVRRRSALRRQMQCALRTDTDMGCRILVRCRAYTVFKEAWVYHGQEQLDGGCRTSDGKSAGTT